MAHELTTVDGYRATQHPDGRLVVHDVEIFCACERDDFIASEVWVKSAVAKAMRRSSERYSPPLHVRHHDPDTARTDSVRPAGHVVVTGTRPITLGGKRRTAVIADLVITNPGVAHEVLTMQLPYRSVEIFDIDAEPSIDGLALLDHEAPYLELPMLEIGDVVNVGGDVASATFGAERLTRADTGGVPVLACFRKDQSATLLFRRDPTMAINTTEQLDTDPKPDVVPAPAPDVALAADPDDKDSEDMADDAGLDVASICKAIESGEISVAEMDAILDAIQNQKPADEPEDDAAPAPAPDEAFADDDTKDENMSANRKNMAAFAKLQGKVDAMEARETARDNSDAAKRDVAEALQRLDGLPLGSGLETKLMNFRKKFPADAFKEYVESFAQNTVAAGDDPSDTASRNFRRLGGKAPDIALKYQDGGADDVDAATQFCREWQQMRESNAGIRTSQEDYVRLNMQRRETRAV